MIAGLACLLLGLDFHPHQTVSSKSIERAVEAKLHASLEEVGSTARIERIQVRGDVQLPPGVLEIIVDKPAGRFPRHRVVVPVTFRVDGDRASSVPVEAMLSDVRPVLVYADGYTDRTASTELELTLRNVDMTCCSGTPILDRNKLAGLRLRRDVVRDAPAVDVDFESSPAVQVNDRVVVSVARGNVFLTSPGTALGDASLGDRVLVRTETSREAFRATVTGPAQVRADE